ncbi:lipid-binding SYLF domain-containing protein [Acidisoma silvae]|uniref:Lipid-binding SYLF domain-containing protein n=1 Tax=Acidisoma silvae TaxID=2802396 RepID=A0A963YPN5_9PROT|nr:lipid-binding SYLF domain-containing protein [Acidisoma silvae]MCB8874744.1 lipid-binding SYLF domain-containing protein [Acidisoma silvae]
MLTRRMLFPTAAAAGLLATAGISTAAHADSGPQDTVNHALGTLQDLRGDKEFGNALQLMHRARAVLIAPRIFKAGFFVGGEGGRAVMMARGVDGSWSHPAFYTIASASFGLQIGAQESEMIMFVMSGRALDALMRNKFQFGANAGLAVATLGSTVAGATTTNAGPDIVVWASSSGAYAGISLDGTLVQPQSDADLTYYGRPLTSREIVLGRMGHNPGALPLVHSIDRL